MRERTRICFIILGIMYSGAEIVLSRFLEGDNTIDPYILLLYKNDEVKNKFEHLYGREKVFSLDFKFNQKNITFVPDLERMKLYNNYKCVIKKIKPELIYINNTTETMLVGGIIKDIPSICHIHDMKSLSRSPIRIWATKRGIKSCKQAITVSKACKEDWGMDMDVIYNGINIEGFNYKETNDIKNIGFIGTPIKRKGLDLVLDSLNDLLSRYDDITFSFAFNGNLNEEFKINIDKICEKYKERIRVFKELQQEEVIKFYDDMDLIIVPSRHDPLPTVIMEAEARGTLVIGTDVDGIPELLNNNKELIMNSITSEELSNKIQYILDLNISHVNEVTRDLFEYAKARFEESVKDRRMNKVLNSIIGT